MLLLIHKKKISPASPSDLFPEGLCLCASRQEPGDRNRMWDGREVWEGEDGEEGLEGREEGRVCRDVYEKKRFLQLSLTAFELS